MVCKVFTTPDGGKGFMCGPNVKRETCACGMSAPFLCDWKTGEGRTCDKPLCGVCATSPAKGKDLCPAHALEWKAWLKGRGGR